MLSELRAGIDRKKRPFTHNLHIGNVTTVIREPKQPSPAMNLGGK